MATNNPRLKEKFNNVILKELKDELGLANVHQVPRLEKIVLNVGIGEAVKDQKLLDAAAKELAIISGQKPSLRRAKKSIAGFKLREGVPLGVKVTLRGNRMYEFLDRLLSISIPRVRDFRGLDPKGFDKQGNYNMGVNEQLIFPEIDYDDITRTRGMNLTFVTTAVDEKAGFLLLKKFGFPFKQG